MLPRLLITRDHERKDSEGEFAWCLSSCRTSALHLFPVMQPLCSYTRMRNLGLLLSRHPA